MGRRRRKKRPAVVKKKPLATAKDPNDSICSKLCKEYHHRSHVLCEDMIVELEKRGLSKKCILQNTKIQRMCARLDPRSPPVPLDSSFLRFFMQICFWNTDIEASGTYKKVLRFVVSDRDVREVECVFPSIVHWCLFAYNKRWREVWTKLVGGPKIEMPDKWSLGIGSYLGSWADAADSENDEMG